MKNKKNKTLIILALLLVNLISYNLQAELLCYNKKSRAVISRPGVSCKKGETVLKDLTLSNSDASLSLSSRSTASTSGTSAAASIALADSGATSSGADVNTGLDLSVSRLNSTGGIVNSTGLNVSVVGDSGGDSTNVGLSVNTTGADTNYCAIFQGGNVGIGVSDPDEQLELTGRIHIGQSSAPTDPTDKLYNIGGTLYWNGQPFDGGTSGEGDITSVSVGSGLTGGGTSGDLTINVDSGTTASKIVQLNGSAELPAVSGINLTALNGSSITSGTIPDARLSANISQLGSQISLGTEVTGTLPVANGGTGATSLSNLFTLGTHTTGNYIASIATAGGISGGAAGSEAQAASLSIDQSFTPTWTGVHSFQGNVNIGTTTASLEKLHLNGRLHLESAAAPAVTTNILYNTGGDLFFNGVNLSNGAAANGDITGVTAGTGLTGGGTSGDLTLNVDTGTAANKIVQLNGSAALPAVSGANLTALDATNISNGTLNDARLSANVSLLGSSIALNSAEVTGTLPTTNGGTGAATLNDLITLTTHTTGNYVASNAVAAGGGISIASTGAEGGTSTFSVDTTFAPSWQNTHTFSGVATDITTVANQDFSIIPHGTGKVGIGNFSPSAMIDVTTSTTSTTAGTDSAAELNITDSGNVTVGTDTTYGLDLNVARTNAGVGSTIDTYGLDISVTGDSGGTSKATGLNVSVTGADTNYAAIFMGGSIGIGTVAPSAALDTVFSSTSASAATEIGHEINVSDTGAVAAGTDITTGMDINVTRTSAGAGATTNTTGLDIAVTGDATGTTSTTGLAISVSGADTNIAATFGGGNVGINDTVSVASTNLPAGSLVLGNGALCIDNGGDDCDNSVRTAGTVYANNTTVQGMDLAENYPVNEGDLVEAADIVVINSQKGFKCTQFSSAVESEVKCLTKVESYIPFVDRSLGRQNEKRPVFGIVSTQPGVTLGGFEGEQFTEYKQVPVALAGRVPVKISLENGEIRIGDRISLSSTPGVGMRANKGDEIVGIALEPLTSELLGNNDFKVVLVLIRNA